MMNETWFPRRGQCGPGVSAVGMPCFLSPPEWRRSLLHLALCDSCRRAVSIWADDADLMTQRRMRTKGILPHARG